MARTMPAVVLLATLLAVLFNVSSPLQSAEGVIASDAAASYPDGFSGDIFGPSTVYSSTTLCCVWIPYATYFPRLPTSGLPRGSLTFPSPYDQNPPFSLGGPNGFQLNGEIGSFEWKGPSSLDFTLTATDGYSTVTKKITLIMTQKGHFAFGANFVLDSNPGSGNIASVPNGISYVGGAITYSATFTTSNWALSGDQFRTTADAWPLAQHWGQTDGTITLHGTDVEGEVKKVSLWIITEMEPIIEIKWTQTLYSNLPVGTTVGTLRTYSDAGIKTVTSTDTDIYFVVSASGYVSINKPLVVGNSQTWNMQLISNTGKAAIFPLKFDVILGQTLPPSAMSFTPGPINDHKRGQVVGQPTVSGFTPTLWTLTNRNSLLDPYGGQMDLFVIDSKTGYVSCPTNAKLPGRTHQVTISATDGPNYAVRTFDIPVTKSVGPTWHVGRNMSNEYPGTDWQDGRGFETLQDVFWAVRGGRSDLDDWAAGYTIMLHADEDPNYFANDNGLRNGEYSLRFGWLGPGTIRTFDLNGPRARVGGYVGRTNGGSDMGGKGFFNIGDGDITLLNLEISWCTGYGDPSPGPGGDMTHGTSCVRKNAGVWGDLTMEGCFVHDNDNGLESGTGPYDVYLRKNVWGNSGSQYVSAGATHANYIGGNGYVESTDNLYYQTINGHNIKTRALSGLIKNNRIYDGERGGASAQIDLPNGGKYVIENNDIMKGPNAQSFAAINFAAEGTGPTGRQHSLVIRNNRITVLVPNGNHFGEAAAIAVAHINPFQWPLGEFRVENNQFYLHPEIASHAIVENVYGDGGYPMPTVAQSGNTFLKEPFALDFKDPGTAHPKAKRLGFFPRSYDGNGDNFPNFGWGFQIETGTDDMRVWVGAPVGTVVGRCRANGSAYWEQAKPEYRSYVSAPQTGGVTWRIVPDANAYYFGRIKSLAPENRYLIDADTGVITVGAAINTTATPDFPRAEYIVVEAKVKSGDAAGKFVWYRFYVATTENKDPTTNTAANIALHFALTMQQASPDWQKSVATAVCTAAGLPSKRCVVLSVVPGSVIVTVQILPPSEDDTVTTSVDEAVTTLRTQLTDESSSLRQSTAFTSVQADRGMAVTEVAQCSDGTYADPCPATPVGGSGTGSNPNSGGGFSTGAIIGIAVGGFAAIVLVVGFIAVCVRVRSRSQKAAMDRLRNETRQGVVPQTAGVSMAPTAAAYLQQV